MAVQLAVNMVKIPVTDIEKAVPFYRDVLGLTEEFIVAEYGWAQFNAGEFPIALYVAGKGGGNGVAGQTDSLHFSTDDDEGLRAQLAAADINPDEHRHTGADGAVFYELQDPDGNTFKIMLC